MVSLCGLSDGTRAHRGYGGYGYGGYFERREGAILVVVTEYEDNTTLLVVPERVPVAYNVVHKVAGKRVE